MVRTPPPPPLKFVVSLEGFHNLNFYNFLVSTPSIAYIASIPVQAKRPSPVIKQKWDNSKALLFTQECLCQECRLVRNFMKHTFNNRVAKKFIDSSQANGLLYFSKIYASQVLTRQDSRLSRRDSCLTV